MPLKYAMLLKILWKIEHLLANAPFSILFSKVFKTLLKFSLIFFQSCLKIENDVMI